MLLPLLSKLYVGFLICTVNINSCACKTQPASDEYAIMNINEFYLRSRIKTNDSRQANLFQTPTPHLTQTLLQSNIDQN